MYLNQFIECLVAIQQLGWKKTFALDSWAAETRKCYVYANSQIEPALGLGYSFKCNVRLQFIAK